MALMGTESKFIYRVLMRSEDVDPAGWADLEETLLSERWGTRFLTQSLTEALLAHPHVTRGVVDAMIERCIVNPPVRPYPQELLTSLVLHPLLSLPLRSRVLHQFWWDPPTDGQHYLGRHHHKRYHRELEPLLPSLVEAEPLLGDALEVIRRYSAAELARVGVASDALELVTSLSPAQRELLWTLTDDARRGNDCLPEDLVDLLETVRLLEA